jgi:hypothetical protein
LFYWKLIENNSAPLGARLKRLWNSDWFFLFWGHDILCGIQVCWVTKHEDCETETIELDVFSRERCDKAVVTSFGDLRFPTNR